MPSIAQSLVVHYTDNMSGKVAVVTGSSRGIGFGIAKELLKRGVAVYLTGTNVARVKESAEKLKKEGYNPQYHQLDVTDKKSVKALADHIKAKHGGLDILVNNAGVMVKDFLNTTYEDANNVLDVNYYGVLNIQEYMFPLLKGNARVVNISSDCGHISNIRNPQWIKRLTKDDIKLEDANAFVEWFLDSVKNDTLKEEDFAEMPILAYRISKVALCALTRVQQREVGKGISVNAMHPGFVPTDMTKGLGYQTLEEAGETAAYLALDIDQSVKGKYFWFDKTEKDWNNPNLPLYCHFEIFGEMLKKGGHM